MTKYLAFCIGCLECGLDSNVIGVYLTRREAQRACNEEMLFKGGPDGFPNHFEAEVFEIEIPEDA